MSRTINMRYFHIVTESNVILKKGYENEVNTWITWRADYEIPPYAIGHVDNALLSLPVACTVYWLDNPQSPTNSFNINNSNPLEKNKVNHVPTNIASVCDLSSGG